MTVTMKGLLKALTGSIMERKVRIVMYKTIPVHTQ